MARAARQGAGRKSRSSVEAIGAQELVGNLFKANATYAQIRAAVQKALGKSLSISALSRYRERWASAEQQLQEAAKEAEAIVKVLQGNPGVNFSEAALGALTGKLVRRFASATEAFETTPLEKLAGLVIKIARAQQSGQALGIQAQRLELLKGKVTATAEKVDALAKASGISDETRNRIRTEIYGLNPA